MSEISEYKEECMRRFKETQKYQKYDKEDLIDELYEKENQLQQKENIIKEVREYIQDRYDGEVLTHTFDKCNVGELLEILGEGE